jgi:polyisoprenoid-binding protein YceI
MVKMCISTVGRGLFLAALALVPVTAAAAPVEFTVLSRLSRAEFRAEAPLETIAGATTDVVGTVSFDAERPEATRGRIEVGLASLSTGGELLDEHLHERAWLWTDQYPKATFDITRVEIERDVAHGSRAKGKVYGTLTVRGVAKDLVADVVVTRLPPTADPGNDTGAPPGEAVKVEAYFRTAFTNHGMQVPEVFVYRLSNDLDLKVTLMLVARAAPPSAK